MTCAEAREAILEADVSELEGDVATPLAWHLGACSRCREVAAAVLAGERGLALELIRAVPELDLDDILAAVTSTSRSASPWRFAPLALAAGLAALFLAREPTSLPGPAFEPAQAAPGLDLEVPPGWTAAVLATDDPNITVLWLFPRSDEI
jgi:hypothetical protein